METSIILKQFGITKENVKYSKKINAFLSNGYTSISGNTYYNVARFAEGILIIEDAGNGHTHTFLNGLKIYSLEKKELIAEVHFSNYIYSNSKVEYHAIKILINALIEAANSNNYLLNINQVRTIVTQTIKNAMKTDQRIMIDQVNLNKLL